MEHYHSRYEPCSKIFSLWYAKYPSADLQHLTIVVVAVSDNQRKAIIHNKDGNLCIPIAPSMFRRLASKGRATHITLHLSPVHLFPWNFLVTFICRIKLIVTLT
jgi:hypothetical protein